MKILSKINVSVVITGLSILLIGLNITYRGNIWNIILDDERYFVGGFAILIGVYFIFLGLRASSVNTKD